MRQPVVAIGIVNDKKWQIYILINHPYHWGTFFPLGKLTKIVYTIIG